MLMKENRKIVWTLRAITSPCSRRECHRLIPENIGDIFTASHVNQLTVDDDDDEVTSL